jgi:hypothetical protein
LWLRFALLSASGDAVGQDFFALFIIFFAKVLLRVLLILWLLHRIGSVYWLASIFHGSNSGVFILDLLIFAVLGQ